MVGVLKIANAISALASPLEGLGDMFEGLGDMFKGVGKFFKAAAFKAQAQAILSYAIAVGILAASVYVLAQLDAGKLWGAIAAMAALAGIIVALSVSIGKLGTGNALELGKFSMVLIALSTSILLLSFALRNLGNMDDKAILKGSLAIAALGAILAGLMATTSKGAVGMGTTLLGISTAILLMVMITKLIAGMETEELVKGISVIAIFSGIIAGLIAATKLAGNDLSKIGGTILTLSFAMLLMAGVISH